MAFSQKSRFYDKTKYLRYWAKTIEFKDSPVEKFHSALFAGDSLWICGWNKNTIEQKHIVFLNVDLQGDDYYVLSKNKVKYPGGDVPITMFMTRGLIFLAKRDGNGIHSFNTKTHEFRRVFGTNELAISAMCGSENFVNILDKNQPGHVLILNSSFHVSGSIKTGLGTIYDCSVDMCSVGDTTVISTSFPLGTIRCLERKHGVVWEINIQNSPQLPKQFNPCSVSAISDGPVFVADRYNDKVSETSMIKKKDMPIDKFKN